jgi:tripartite-type tricarboxylate transporter receptor subunit TctC
MKVSAIQGQLDGGRLRVHAEENAMAKSWIPILAVLPLCLGLHVNESAEAQDYPNKPIRILVPAAPGGPSDLPARLTSQILPPKLGQPVVVENRPGAGGAIGSREVAKAIPDGYTLLSAGGAQLAVLPAMSNSARYDPTRDFAPIAKFVDGFQILVVSASSPWKSVKELVAFAQANPGRLNYAHVGTGHLTHLAGELFMARTGVSLVGVPYRSGGESVTAVLSETVNMTFENVAILLPLIREGKLRALAVTSKTRTALAPDLPTMIEAGVPDYEVTTFFGLVAPAGTPSAIVGKLNSALNEALRTPQMQDAILKTGAIPAPGSPEEFAASIASDLEKWRALGKIANIKIN